jgi:hypothetical protein
VPIRITGLASDQSGEGESGASFLMKFDVCARLPLPTRLQVYLSGVVYDGFRSDNRQDPTDMKKAIPSL